MRLEMSNYLVSSVSNAFRMLQTIVDDADLQKTHQHAMTSTAHPNLSGCVDSPEASTILLMVLGAAGIYYGSRLCARKLGRGTAGAPLA